jgi:inhibitor of KinA sporulation pathway (predicted exonuclease)
LKDLETIQIGYVIFDSQFNLLQKWSIFVKPTKNPILSAFIQELTWINQDQVDSWVSFHEWLKQMMKLFKDYHCGYMLSYWNYDAKQLYSDCQINNIIYLFFEWDKWHSEKHINIKNALASKLNMREKWMENLMKYLWLELEWKHHNWEDDCYNIFRIIKNQFLSTHDK